MTDRAPPPDKERLTPTQAKSLRGRVWLYLLLAIVSMLIGIPRMLYLRFHTPTPTEVAQAVSKKTGIEAESLSRHVRISGADYDIPLGYFRATVPHYIEDVDIYLVVLRDTFSLVPGGEDAYWHKLGVNADSFISILAHGYFNDMETLGEHALCDHGVHAGTKFGLETYALSPGVRDTDRQEPFLHSEDGHIVTVITCSKDFIKGAGAHQNPICTHFFSDGYLTYQLSYAKKLDLQNWQRYEAQTRALFADFRERAKKKHLDQVQIPLHLVEPLVFDYQAGAIDRALKRGEIRRTPADIAREEAQKTARDIYSLTKHLRIGKADYDIPIGYFAFEVSPYTHDTGMTLMASRSDYSIPTKSISELVRLNEQASLIRIDVFDPAGSHTPEEKTASTFYLTRKSVPTGKQLYGLDGYDFTKGPEPPKFWKVPKGEPYTHAENGHVTTLIRCFDEVKPVPPSWDEGNCDHDFFDGYLVYVTHYPAARLPEWKQVEDGAKKLFAGFRARGRQKELDKLSLGVDETNPQIVTQGAWLNR